MEGLALGLVEPRRDLRARPRCLEHEVELRVEQPDQAGAEAGFESRLLERTAEARLWRPRSPDVQMRHQPRRERHAHRKIHLHPERAGAVIGVHISSWEEEAQAGGDGIAVDVSL